MPETIVKFTKLSGTKVEVLIEKSFAQLCCDSATVPKDENMEVFFEEEFDTNQVKSHLPHIMAEANIFELTEFEAEVDAKRREEGQRAPRWLIQEGEDEEAEAEKEENDKASPGGIKDLLIHDDDEEQAAAKKRRAKELFAFSKEQAAKRRKAEAYLHEEKKAKSTTITWRF